MVAFGAIEVWVPVVVFVFGLSMDYEVFLLSRIEGSLRRVRQQRRRRRQRRLRSGGLSPRRPCSATGTGELRLRCGGRGVLGRP
jgi:hypothetical protein